jgi:hypothetical protein
MQPKKDIRLLFGVGHDKSMASLLLHLRSFVGCILGIVVLRLPRTYPRLFLLWLFVGCGWGFLFIMGDSLFGFHLYLGIIVDGNILLVRV